MFRNKAALPSKTQFCLGDHEVRWEKLERERESCCCSSTPPGRGSTPQDYRSSRALLGRMQKLPCSFWVDAAFVLMVFLASAVGSLFNGGNYSGALLCCWPG